jgi:hypothetical protein
MNIRARKNPPENNPARIPAIISTSPKMTRIRNVIKEKKNTIKNSPVIRILIDEGFFITELAGRSVCGF